MHPIIVNLLLCPQCQLGCLASSNNSVLVCRECFTEYPMLKPNSTSLIAKGPKDSTKTKIREFWGDTAKQWYSSFDDTLSFESLSLNLEWLESMLIERSHLATREINLNNLRGKLVLEVGSGAGATSALFCHHGASVVATDITPERVQLTSNKLALVRDAQNPERPPIAMAFEADAENLPFQDNSFDIVYSNGVLHHTENTEKAVEEIYRVVKPGGKCVVMLYSRHSATYWLSLLPKGIISGEVFRLPEAEWIGKITEGTPQFGTTKNPLSRVYSKRQLQTLFQRFESLSLRKNSYNIGMIAIPKADMLRSKLLKLLGYKSHEGGEIVYGREVFVETKTEQFLGRYIGSCWNINADK